MYCIPSHNLPGHPWSNSCTRAFGPCAYLILVLTSLLLLPSLAAADLDHEADTAAWLQVPIAMIPDFFPTPWMCGGTAPNPPTVLQFHRNWHCTNPDHFGANWGNKFFGFHKQFLV